MTTLTAPMPADVRDERGGVPWLFPVAAVAVALASAGLAGWAPIGFSLATVFLFAGPHNWLEFRYFLTRMPAVWGPLRTYFATGIGGVAVLTVAFWAMPFAGDHWQWSYDGFLTAYATWLTGVILWVAVMAALRGLQPGSRARPWVWPVALLLTAGAWVDPALAGMVLVYGHPLIALWFLDRELLRRRPEWRAAYHRVLLLVPVLLAGLWWQLASAPDLAGGDALTERITRHAGAGLLSGGSGATVGDPGVDGPLAGVSTHCLVATHTFLEMLHYGVWVVAVPLIGFTAAPWNPGATPLGRRSVAWRRVLTTVFAAGALVVAALWVGFAADYGTTRDLYFTIAIGHVLAEVPFLLRLL